MTENWLDFDRYAVWGLGRSGKAAANLLARHHKQVVASDIRPRQDLSEDIHDLGEDVEVVTGKNAIADAEVIVTSPGLRPGLEVFDRARDAGIPVISEVDLAFDASSSIWVAITGTDGKTTTTSLVGSMLEAAGLKHVVAGNIGTALCDVVENLGSQDVVVAEVSANQLWSCHHLSVDTAAITNIAEDHRDYFDDFRDYPKAKRRLVELQGPEADAVLPIDDAGLREALAPKDNAHITWFGNGEAALAEVRQAVYFDAQKRGLWHSEDRRGVWLEDFDNIELIGPHNQLNASCAAAIARTVGASWDDIARGLRSFESLPHRMESIREVDGVRFIDDSKATNAHASLAGLEGIDSPLVVIAGGRDKGLDLQQWSQIVGRRADHVVVIGEIADKMETLLDGHRADVTRSSTLEDAVAQAYKHARPGSTVVLSPACSSYDMFSNYKERGRVFQRAVAGLVSPRSS